MSISIDDRSGSVELYHMFPAGTPVEVARMEFGDFAFVGNGEEGPVFVGIERKTVRDLLNSITTGRLSGHQLIGLLDAYRWVYLIVEGMWRFNPDSGILEDRKGMSWSPVQLGSRRYMAREMVGYLNTMAVKAGVIILYSKDKRETVQVVTSIYHWWQKGWEEHSSHLSRNKAGSTREVSLIRPNLVRRAAAELEGVGWVKSKSVADTFPTLQDMVEADVKDWLKIEGIGKKLSQQIVNEIKGGI